MGLANDLENYINRKRLKNKDFTIICNNCYAGFIYSELGLMYTTPFVGLGMYTPCFLRMLKDPKRYLSGKIEFIKTSIYPERNEIRKNNPYPIGLIGGDAEVHLSHYSSEAEVREKWARRIARINWNNIFVIMDDRLGFEVKYLEEFDRLDFPRKICFTSKYYKGIKSAVWCREYENQASIDGPFVFVKTSKNDFDIVEWLNGGDIRIGFCRKIINRLFSWIHLFGYNVRIFSMIRERACRVKK